MNINKRTLFFGDNLEILQRKIPDEFFDLIYLDPPFNSNRNYNVLFKEGKVDSTAQIHAFEDTWKWTGDTVRLFDVLSKHPNPRIAILVSSLAEFIGHNEMMAYLVNMTARLIPLLRVLKNTGSFYLHCDPTASHYLKVILDVIFEKRNFRNEIIWSYRRWTAVSNRYQKLHDTIFFYTKGDKYTFNTQYEPYGDWINKDYGYIDEETGKRWRWHTVKGKRYKVFLEDKERGVKIGDVWQIAPIGSTAKERIGYPTQKPEKLLERIISTSTKEGDWVLDPFCGCGTTVAVAEKLHRNWVGIDISMQAINVITQRMNDHYPQLKINTDGLPMDFEAACNLAEKDKFSFQDWAISLIGAHPPSGETRKGADQGVDGLILFRERADFGNPHPKLRKIVVQVKGGGTGRGDIAKLKGDMAREDSPLGVMITLNDPTSEMKKEAALAGEYKYSDTVSFLKIQILSIKDWFNKRTVKLPTDVIDPFKKAEVKPADQEKLL